jgi:hypothetical protein
MMFLSLLPVMMLLSELPVPLILSGARQHQIFDVGSRT